MQIYLLVRKEAMFKLLSTVLGATRCVTANTDKECFENGIREKYILYRTWLRVYNGMHKSMCSIVHVIATQPSVK
jgi:hypothetical protein